MSDYILTTNVYKKSCRMLCTTSTKVVPSVLENMVRNKGHFIWSIQICYFEFIIRLVLDINPCAAELFASIFHLTQFPASKWWTFFMTKYTSPILNYWINSTEKSTEKYFIKFCDISIDLKYAWNRIYTVPAAQGLIVLNSKWYMQNLSIFGHLPKCEVYDIPQRPSPSALSM